MKISELTFFTIAAGVMLLSSCNNDELNVTEEQQNLVAAPAFSGTIGQLADVNTPEIRAGVIEDNENYAEGELFYWHNNDKVKVLFFEDGDLKSQLTYTAVVPDGTKPGNCEFTANGSIPPGDYTVYALYPADSWEIDATGYKAKFVLENMILFSDVSSAHLKDYMFMKADAGNVSISGEGDNNAINLNFEHLTSVVRFHITSDYDANSMEATSLKLSEMSGANFFYHAAYLDRIDGMGITPVPDSEASSLIVYPMVQGLSFVKKGSTWEFDYYMPIFPTKTSTEGMKLQIETWINHENTYQQEYFGTDNGLTFDNQLDFMPDGFEAGKSYYFNLKTTF